MGTITVSDETMERLLRAAAANHVSLEQYLRHLTETDALPNRAESRAAAAESIRNLAREIKSKSTVQELIADKHAGHKY